jgi:trans-aconitate 2-methyltransferase
MSKWDANQYLRFTDQRLRPAIDLLMHLPEFDAASIYDLGCGTGHITELIAKRWANAKVIGLDNSAEMLAKAKGIGGIEWQQADLATWRPSTPIDLIYSNATLQWLPNHRELFPRLIKSIRKGGYLAVQMPHNHGAASHQAIIETAEKGPWSSTLTPLIASMPSAESPETYYELLRDFTDSLDIWETEYLQVLEGEYAVAEWTKGSVLKPLLDALEPNLREKFFSAYAKRVSSAYRRLPSGHTLFPFRRIFIIAQR